MISLKIDHIAGVSRFVIEPNRSLSADKLWLAYGVIAGSCLLIAIVFAVRGFWLILPFAGLEIALIAYGFYYTFKRCSTIEVIKVSRDTLYIERGCHYPEQQHKFITAWVRVNHQLAIGHYPSRLLIRSHGKEIEVGVDLTEDDRETLATQLNEQLDAYRHRH